jgi:outer membrane protein assembly factor BamE
MRTLLLSLAATVLIAACSTTRLPVSPYKIDVQQGNVFDQDMLEKLKPGMTRSQVTYLLGTPLLVDPFRKDRWDYVYNLYKADKLVKQQRVSLFFDGNVLARMETRDMKDEGFGNATTQQVQSVSTAQTAASTTEPQPQNASAASSATAGPAAAGGSASNTAVTEAVSSGAEESGQSSIVPPLGTGNAGPALSRQSVAATSQPAAGTPVELKPDTNVAAVAPESVSTQGKAASKPQDETAVLDSVDHWAKAWSARNVRAYVATYSSDFKPADGRSRAVWERRHRALFRRVKWIKVEIESPTVSFPETNLAVVRFTQHYRSDIYSDNVTKQLTLEQKNGKWLIRDEQVLPSSGDGK